MTRCLVLIVGAFFFSHGDTSQEADRPTASAPAFRTYHGVLTPDAEDSPTGIATFELVYFGSMEAGEPLSWVLDTSGAGVEPWWQRLGVLAGDNAIGPKLVVPRPQADHHIPIADPRFQAPVQLEAGARWEEGPWSYAVQEASMFRGRSTWSIRRRDRVGRQGRLEVDAELGIVLRWEGTVFVGRGERHTLEWALASDEPPMPTERWQDLFAAMLDLRTELGTPPASGTWPEGRLAWLRTQLEQVPETEADGALAQLVRDARRAARDGSARADEVARMRDRAEGRRLERQTLTDLDGDDHSIGGDGPVTVLHFWDYRHEPLREPYGQVGFLDFYNRQIGDEVRVFGVCVQPGLADPDRRRAALASARRFCSFMNLSYPVITDDRDLLRTVGDPRPAGLELPLFVVLDREGTVIHYHPGLYDADLREGLQELAEVVRQASQPRP